MNKVFQQKEVVEFIENADLKHQEIIRKLIEIVIESNPELACAIKWQQLTFALNNDFHHWICAIKKTKSSVNLNFHFGSYLIDNSNLLIAQTSKFLRQMKFCQINELNKAVITDFVQQAINKLPEFKATWKEVNKGS